MTTRYPMTIHLANKTASGKHGVQWLFAICALLLLSCCTHLKPADKITIAQGVDIPLVLPTQYRTVTQKVTGTFHNETHTLIMQIQSQANELVMAGLTPTGTRLFSASFDGQKITSWQSPLFNAPFDGSYLLADFQLSTMNLALLQHILPSGARVTENTANSAVERTFYNAAGKAIIHVRYSNPDKRTDGIVDYCHIERNYCLHIEPLASEDIP